jgi:hypothetical protein
MQSFYFLRTKDKYMHAFYMDFPYDDEIEYQEIGGCNDY